RPLRRARMLGCKQGIAAGQLATPLAGQFRRTCAYGAIAGKRGSQGTARRRAARPEETPISPHLQETQCSSFENQAEQRTTARPWGVGKVKRLTFSRNRSPDKRLRRAASSPTCPVVASRHTWLRKAQAHYQGRPFNRLHI